MRQTPYTLADSCFVIIINYFHPAFSIYLMQTNKFITITHETSSHACRTNIKQFTILSRGPKLWNSLPDTVRKAETLSSFRNRMMKYLFDS